MSWSRSLYKYLLLFYIFAFLFATVFLFLQKALAGVYTSFNYFQLFLNQFVSFGSKFIFIAFAIWVTTQLIKRKFSIVKSLCIHTILITLLTIYSSYILMVFERTILPEPEQSSGVFIRILYSFNFNFFIYFTMIAFVYAFFYFQKQRQDEIKTKELKSELLKAKLDALQYQLQPHFLFNAMNNISALIDLDKIKSQDAIANLGDLLRNTLQLNNVNKISVEEELSLVNKYIKIEKLRFGENLSVKVVCDDNLLHYHVPPLIIQPILENAIKHGYGIGYASLDVCIYISEIENIRLKILITNDGQPIDLEILNNGTGIENIRSRLINIYGNDTLTIWNENNKVNVKMIIPLQ